ncbi:MAG: hypothetical protein JEZ02_02180 [Desulfatibacillum sp.]|nr:hypothetical protein [Desulfatibacillum sp.]
MKKLAVLLIFSLILASCASREEPLIHPLPEDKPMYGVTHDGVFFIHDSLVLNAEVESVQLASQATEWKKRPMEKVGDYHIYDCRNDNHDRALFVFYRNYFKIQYCFYTDKYASIPGVFSGNKEISKHLDPEDLSITAKVGPIFYTTVVEEGPPLW